MLVLALDLGMSCGIALGRAEDEHPFLVDCWDLSKTRQFNLSADDRGPGLLAVRLRYLFREHGIPDLGVVEQMMRPKAQKNENTIVSQGDLHGAARAVMALWRIPYQRPHCNTVRFHFCGQAHAGGRDETKAMVMRRARQVGHILHNEMNDNFGDAAALWDWGVFNHLRRARRDFHLFQAQGRNHA